ncbi:MAG TPA: papain-like cysteine protease family protein [Verrucomicrobiae bacterium]|jgi:hypothetical protein
MAYPELFNSARLGAIYLGTDQAGLQSVAQVNTSGGAGLGGGGSGGGGGNDYQLSFTMQHQAQNQWCWAAVSVSVSFFGSMASVWTQCALVSDQVNDKTCCTDGTTLACDVTWYLEKALRRTNNLVDWQEGALTGAEIVAQLSANLAVACRIGWSDGISGHFVVITGYQNDGTSETVVVDDPLYYQSQISLDEFTERYRHDGKWTHTYFTKR